MFFPGESGRAKPVSYPTPPFQTSSIGFWLASRMRPQFRQFVLARHFQHAEIRPLADDKLIS